MKKTMTWLFILTKRTLKSPLLLILLFIMPILAIVVNKLPGFDTELAYCAGIYLEGEDKLAVDLRDALTDADGIFKFVEYTDLDQMYEDVRSEKINCGYILPSNFSHRTSISDIRECITVIKPPNSNIQPAVNEFVYAALIKLQNAYLLPNFVESTGLFEELTTEQIDSLLAYYNTYADSDRTFKVIFQSYGVAGITEQKGSTQAVTFPLRGILAIMVFLAGIFGAATFMMDREKGIFDTLSIKYRIICQVVYIFIPAFLFGVCALLTLGLSGTFTVPLIEIGAMLLLIFLVTLFGQGLIYATRNSKICIACIPGMLIGSLIFCPVFLHASSYVPAAKFIEKLFVPFYYLSIFS